jgi:hypothetical protein
MRARLAPILTRGAGRRPVRVPLYDFHEIEKRLFSRFSAARRVRRPGENRLAFRELPFIHAVCREYLRTSDQLVSDRGASLLPRYYLDCA